MIKPKLKLYKVMVKCKVDVYVDVKAESLDQAFEKAKHLDNEDLFTFKGEYIDGETTVYGVFES